METYAFWRPPVRTLTFEDFTTMQKQQGKALGKASALPRTADEGSWTEHGTASPKPTQQLHGLSGTKKTYSFMNNKSTTGSANENSFLTP